MRKLHYAVVDVFTNRRWAGNPLGVVKDADGLTDAEMLAITREINHSETTFLFRRPKAVESVEGVRARIFTPKEEVPFAGHPTLGTAWLLNEQQAGTTVTLDLKLGKVPVAFQRSQAGLFGEMVQPEPAFGQMHKREEIARLIGLPVDEVDATMPIQTVSTGRPKIMVPIHSLAAIRKVKMDFAGITAYCAATDQATALYLVTRETEGHNAQAHARHILSWKEDPVTGSAGGACIAWMVAHGWAKPGASVTIEQGSEAGRPGAMTGSADKRDGRVTRVRLGGQCVLAGEGEMWV